MLLIYLPAMCTVINQNMMKTSTIYNLKEEQHICIIIYIYIYIIYIYIYIYIYIQSTLSLADTDGTGTFVH